jgi:hypothetical protein
MFNFCATSATVALLSSRTMILASLSFSLLDYVEGNPGNSAPHSLDWLS